MGGTLLAETLFKDDGKGLEVRVRVYAPLRGNNRGWTCRVQADAPFGIAEDAEGPSSMEALVAALRRISTVVYSNRDFREGRLRQAGLAHHENR